MHSFSTRSEQTVQGTSRHPKTDQGRPKRQKTIQSRLKGNQMWPKDTQRETKEQQIPNQRPLCYIMYCLSFIPYCGLLMIGEHGDGVLLLALVSWRSFNFWKSRQKSLCQAEDHSSARRAPFAKANRGGQGARGIGPEEICTRLLGNRFMFVDVRPCRFW